ncbi:protein EXECUTER 2, chloroplastic [Impatiens glandulifera]|uniref:protein EXECUTER 2, chloroplastic n=1 Tax=Impatiens glandulifera TaxID=253017 RepID=UPI001FB05BFD|nr:protein EXECUTER 2, chloroplastic [Impatiens glandulifera]
MAVTNGWERAGHSIPITQFKPCSSFYSSPTSSISVSFHGFLKNPINLKFALCRNWGTQKKQFLNKGRKSRNLCCLCSFGQNNSIDDIIPSSNWDWNRWTRHFSEIEQAESFTSVLKFQLEEAIEKEDFEEASKLKAVITEATSSDSVAKMMAQLKKAIDEERYHDASQMSKCMGSGLIGWWVGCPKDSNVPFGKLIRISPGVGRFVGRSYSPRQLVNSSPGSPLFEIFVVKNVDGTYTSQVVFLQRAKKNLEISTHSSSKSNKGPSTSDLSDNSNADVTKNENKTEKNEDKIVSVEGVTEEGITSVINFLKEKIPELKLKLMKFNVSEEVIGDIDAVKQLIDEDSEDKSSIESSDDEANIIEDTEPDRVIMGESEDASADGENLDMKVFIGGVLHNKEDTTIKDEFVRVPAEIENMERDSFVLHVPALTQDTTGEEKINVKVAAVAAKGISELMPSDVAKAFLGSDKISSKISKNVREIVKLAVSQAQKRDRLTEFTSFSRVLTSEGDLDPFDGLYVGAFGPYGTEVVQLRRKYGNWTSTSDSGKSSDVEFFEYVEAVKLTGDLNVPAGEVTFRAKIGRCNRNPNRGVYPDDLGVVASYKGQGRIAEFGFRKAKWVDGELLQLNGKGMGPYVRGADLGFLYVVPDQSFLVLFNRLKLPE